MICAAETGERAVVYGTDLTKRCGGHKKGLAQARDGGGTKKLESYSIFLGFSVGPRKRCRCSLHRPGSSFAVLKVFSSSPLFLFLPPLFVHYAVLCILLLHKLPSLGCHSLGGPTFFQTFRRSFLSLLSRQLAGIEPLAPLSYKQSEWNKHTPLKKGTNYASTHLLLIRASFIWMESSIRELYQNDNSLRL